MFIGFQPAARVGDKLVCVGPPDSVSRGEPTVRIGGKHAARIGDPTSHGGIIVKGCPTVLIGSSAQADTLRTDKPFCEDCERKRKAQEKKKAKGK
ncbi:PAAR domain-containing protein [Polyangium mundeleinium]|uniref:PAAR domain-containing protein n=1 Tax=Polyangium mundeleinium TaxID=2995306 RepID=UPI00358DD2D4